MAQTNTVSVFDQMTTVTASGVADRPEDCSKLLLPWLRSSFCQVLFLSQWQRGSRSQNQTPVWSSTRAIPERLRGVFTTRRYTKSTFTLPYLYLWWWWSFTDVSSYSLTVSQVKCCD